MKTIPFRLTLWATTIVAAFFGTTSAQAAPEQGLLVGRLRCEYRENPLGIDDARPRLEWQSVSGARGQRQTAYQILVANSAAALKARRGDLWDSGKVASDASTQVEYAGRPLGSGLRVWWTVRVWDRDGAPSSYSAPARWQMGLLRPADWKGAQWISVAMPPRDGAKNAVVLPPSPLVRRSFTLAKPIKRATLYVTSRGVYEMRINGARIGDAVLSPGWTDYRKRISYETHDVTNRLYMGANAIGALLGDGWYSGYVGFGRQRDHYGTHPSLLAHLAIEYADGGRETITTDKAWRGSVAGPIRSSDMLMGETYDARREQAGWDKPGFSDANWQAVTTRPNDGTDEPTGLTDITARLRARITNNAVNVVATNALAGGDPIYNTPKQLRVEYTINGAPHSQTVKEDKLLQIPAPGEESGPLVIRRAVYGALDRAASGPIALVAMQEPPVRVTQYLRPLRVTKPTSGVSLYDLGQNMVGWARLKIQGAEPGTRVQLRFGEMLNPDGTLYTTNLRAARATDTYICRGGAGVETWEPRFTFHGFRYVEVTGLPSGSSVLPDAITGCVIGSDLPQAGTFFCSDLLVNRLQSNIVWGQRGNFVSVPTDCPQRDERLGWMGDAQIFARTATYNRDMAAFYGKWLQDVEDAQSADGGFSDVAPRQVDQADGAPAWGDAGVIVPWTVYQAYGDKRVLQNRWAAMTRWMNYITSANPDGLWNRRRNNDFGDWLSINADTPKDVLATAYYAYDAQLMARMARALHKSDEAQKYDDLFARIKDAFNKAYVTGGGKIKGDTQTAYVLALRFDLLPENVRPLAARRLADNIASKNGHLSTGFVGVGYLCPVLTANGYNDVAYKLLLNDTFPSWGYSIRQGATTIWERWDGWTADKGFQDPGMNSFNHYSLGSVGQWLYQDVVGIDTDPNQPGYKHILLRPQPGGSLSFARAELASPYGKIRSAWKKENGQLTYDITVPVNSTATVWVPAGNASDVTESGERAETRPGVAFVRAEPGFAVYEVQSGVYRFAAPLTSR